MKIGITADLHLTSKERHPDRWNALVDILDQCKQQKIEHLIIAGDLFDAAMPNHSEFEAICKSAEYSKIQFLIIPGNHDPRISKKQIVANNIHIFDQPACEKFADEWEFCFIPYRDGQTMGKTISEIPGRDPGWKWALVGHGDWLDRRNAANQYEGSKIYMPITRKEVELLKPDYIFLGHIHASYNKGIVFYTGSPCPVAMNETGYRRFLVFDTLSGTVKETRVNSDVVYFSMELLMMPVEDEKKLILNQIDQCKQNWLIDERDHERIKVQVKVVGYSNDRSAIIPAIEQGFSGFRLLEEPDISEVNNAADPSRNFILDKFMDELNQVDYDFTREGEPDANAVLLKAMEMVYRRE